MAGSGSWPWAGPIRRPGPPNWPGSACGGWPAPGRRADAASALRHPGGDRPPAPGLAARSGRRLASAMARWSSSHRAGCIPSRGRCCPALRDRVVSVAPSARAWLRARAAVPPARRRVVLARGPGLATDGAEVPALAPMYDGRHGSGRRRCRRARRHQPAGAGRRRRGVAGTYRRARQLPRRQPAVLLVAACTTARSPSTTSSSCGALRIGWCCPAATPASSRPAGRGRIARPGQQHAAAGHSGRGGQRRPAQ